MCNKLSDENREKVQQFVDVASDVLKATFEVLKNAGFIIPDKLQTECAQKAASNYLLLTMSAQEAASESESGTQCTVIESV